jgi:hypothetical protein
MVNYCFVVPINPGAIEVMKKWNEENIVNNKEHDAVFRSAGVSREQVWIQHTSQGDFAVVSFETKNPKNTFEEFANSKEPWAIKFREYLQAYSRKVHGIDFTQSPSINEMIVNWQETESDK